jgi:hypothetical protein
LRRTKRAELGVALIDLTKSDLVGPR